MLFFLGSSIRNADSFLAERTLRRIYSPHCCLSMTVTPSTSPTTRRRATTLHDTLRPFTEQVPTTNSPNVKDHGNIIIMIERNKPSFWVDTMAPVMGMVSFSFCLAILLLAWEDLTCSYVLPSRHRTSFDESSSSYSFARSTIKGLGFGYNERQLLQHIDPETSNLPSYNEVMLQHRTERVPRWKDASVFNNKSPPAAAIHVMVQCLQTVQKLKLLAEDYQWESIRTCLHTEPLATQLEAAASQLRVLERHSGNAESVIGFDWGSCAWRHCGALADSQEALDELDYLLGVLEPREALFCLDVVERSLREILASVNWKLADKTDVLFWKELKEYRPLEYRSTSDSESQLDDEYIKALQELRID